MNESIIESQRKFSRLIRRFFLERPPRVKEKNYQHFVMLSIMTYFGVFTHASWIPLFWILGVKQLALLNILSVSLFLVAINLNRKGFHLSSMTVIIFEVCLHQTLCVIIIGWSAGFQYYILALPFGIFFMPHGRNFIKLVLMLVCFFNYSLLDYFYRTSEPLIIINLPVLNAFNYSNIVIFVALASFASYFFNAKVYDSEKALRKEQNKVAKAYSLLSKYVAPQLVDTISDGQIDLIWQHSRKKLTLFFSDIKDFTTITDSMEPEDMAGLLNEYLTEMNAIVNKYRGTLAQVIGDALYVFFGSPERSTDQDHALRCVKMAMEMQQKLKTLNDRWFERGVDEVLQIRCGINTGMATVGGYGSSERKEYTAMGMQVNIAARLEQACEPGSILISHTTWALVKDEISCSEQGKINVKGLQRPIRAYGIDVVVA
jgi:class 3 adenylate cyclase